VAALCVKDFFDKSEFVDKTCDIVELDTEPLQIGDVLSVAGHEIQVLASFGHILTIHPGGGTQRRH